MIKKIIVSIMGIAMIGQLTIVDLGTACLRLNENQVEIVFNPDVILYGIENKLCIEEEDDYQVVKEAVIKRWHDNGYKISVWGEGYFSPEFSKEEEFLAVIQEELRRGNLTKDDILTSESFESALEIMTNSYNFSYFPDPLKR